MPTEDDSVFVIPVHTKMYRYLFEGGRTMDVMSPFGANSTDRGLVLAEALRRWGGKAGTDKKVGDWVIVGVAELHTAPPPQDERLFD